MATYKIGGEEFPLCLTVASIDQLNELCGGLQGLIPYVADKDLGTGARHTAEVMRLLMLGGKANAEATARINGTQTPELPPVPIVADLLSACTFAELPQMRGAALDAITESLHQDVTADREEHDSKNGDAGQ